MRDGGIHEKGVDAMRLRVKFAMEALMERRRRGQVPCEIRDGGINEKGVEIVTLQMKQKKRDGSLNGKGAGEVRFLVQSAMAEIIETETEVVRLRVKFAMQALMEKAPEKSGSLGNPRWRN